MQFWNSVEIVWRALDECVGVKWCALHDSLTPRLPGQLSGSFFAIPLRFPRLRAAVSQVLCFAHIRLLPNKRALTGLLIELLQLHTRRSIWCHVLVNIACKYISGGYSLGWVWGQKLTLVFIAFTSKHIKWTVWLHKSTGNYNNIC